MSGRAIAIVLDVLITFVAIPIALVMTVLGIKTTKHTFCEVWSDGNKVERLHWNKQLTYEEEVAVKNYLRLKWGWEAHIIINFG